MDAFSVEHQARVREIERRAYVEGYAAETVEIRGFPLSADERAGIEADAARLYPEPNVTSTRAVA